MELLRELLKEVFREIRNLKKLLYKIELEIYTENLFSYLDHWITMIRLVQDIIRPIKKICEYFQLRKKEEKKRAETNILIHIHSFYLSLLIK